MRTRLSVILVLLLLLSLAACDIGGSSDNPDATDVVQLVEDVNVVSATGEVRPARWANLSFPVGGTVTTVHAEEGQQVMADNQHPLILPPLVDNLDALPDALQPSVRPVSEGGP